MRTARSETAVVQHDLRRRMLGEGSASFDECLVQHQLSHAAAAVGGDHELRSRVVDARGEARGGESAEHHRMDRAYPGAARE